CWQELACNCRIFRGNAMDFNWLLSEGIQC
ncbi:MAG: hypothetical protein ACI8PP_002414, partial [Candidatus Pseudothioglobus sp.]